MMLQRLTTQEQRKKRISTKIKGTEKKPRLSVFRSNRTIYAQIIDDMHGKTIIGISEKHVDAKGTKTEKAKLLGITLAEKAKEKHITQVVFDKGGYRYHGRVKAVAQGAREGGLQF